MIPKQITYVTIKQIHSSVYHAHLGRNKTIKKMTDRIYKPFLKIEIIEMVKTCDTCQTIKRDQSKKLAEMLLILPTEPNQMITTDIGGPLKETNRGNKYFIVVIDHFTKFIQLHPLKRIQAEDVAQIFIDKWMMKFGILESLFSDGGTQYRSKLIESVYGYLDIQGLKFNSFSSRMQWSKWFKQMIKSHIEDDQDNWDLILDKIAFALNTSTYESTRQTPFELQFGQKPKIPIDVLLPNDNLYTREKILKEILVKENDEELLQLEDIDEDKFEQNLPQVAQLYLKNLKTSMQASFKACQQNVNIRMNKEYQKICISRR